MTPDPRGVRWERAWAPPDAIEERPPDTGGYDGTGPVAIENVVNGELVDVARGTMFWTSETHDVTLARARGWPDDVARRGLPVAFNDAEARGFELERALFIDTETTGLSGGAGTYVFLVGCGWVERGALRVDQFFMRDQADEPAMLAHLDALLRRFDWVLTFNGAAFDLPLLRTRFIMNRMRASVDALSSLDLLHAARRLWKYRLRDRSLGSLEQHVLGVRRVSDVPSALIPEIYFNYLHSGDARMLGPVFDHNRQDIVSLALLLDRVCTACGGWSDVRLTPEELLGVAGSHALAGDRDTAAAAYDQALAAGLSGSALLTAQTRLSLHYKRSGDWTRAADLWRAMTGQRGQASAWALVELAKHHEHRRRDFAAARDCTLRALRLARAVPASPPLPLAEPALAHRLRRLERRLADRASR